MKKSLSICTCTFLIVMLSSAIDANSQTLKCINETRRYIKDEIKHKVSFKFDYYDHGPDFEKKCIEFLFRDTLSSSLKEAMDLYCKQFERTTEHERGDEYCPHSFKIIIADTLVSEQQKYVNYLLSRTVSTPVGGELKKTTGEWNIVYDVRNNRILGVDNIMTPDEAAKIKAKIGNRRFQLIVYEKSMVYGYMRKGEFVSSEIEFGLNPELFLDEFKSEIRHIQIHQFNKRQLVRAAAVPLEYFCAENYNNGGLGKSYKHPSSIDYTSLAKEITKGCINEYQCIRAIYQWICSTIEYDTSYTIYSADECFRKKRGVCHAYCELFYQIAKCVGVRVELISGKSRSRQYQVSSSGHCWLFAYTSPNYGIFLDPTWGAGWVSGKQFIRDKNCWGWFNVDPEWLILSHRPHDDHWQYIENPLTMEEFKSIPYTNELWMSYGLNYHDIYVALREKKQTMPTIYSSKYKDSDEIQFVDIPLCQSLQVGKTYSFLIKGDPKNNFRFAYGYKNYLPNQWRDEGNGFYSIDLKMEEAGDLIFYYNRWKILKYEVIGKTEQ